MKNSVCIAIFSPRSAKNLIYTDLHYIAMKMAKTNNHIYIGCLMGWYY